MQLWTIGIGVLTFLCLGVSSNQVGQTLQAARRHNLEYAGENALPRYDRTAYYQIAYQARRVKTIDGFTYLRLTDQLLGIYRTGIYSFVFYLIPQVSTGVTSNSF